MPLLNYTTSVSADKTVSEVQKMLVKFGAEAIMTEYRDGLVTALSFKVYISQGQLASFRLPTDWTPVLKVLERQRVQPRYQTDEHANKVAWRITKDWVEAQLALIETNMAKTEQIFLPYMLQQDGRTLYEVMAQNKFLLPSNA